MGQSDLKERSFHLSLGVNSLSDSEKFFVEILKSKVVHRDPSGYINIDFFGSQITLKETPGISPELKELHFGVNLNIDEFDDLTNSILKSKYEDIVSSPVTVDAGTEMERKKMYLKSPTGYLFELKGYR